MVLRTHALIAGLTAAGTGLAALYATVVEALPGGAEYLGFAGILLLVLQWQAKAQQARDQATRELTNSLIDVTRSQAASTQAIQQALEQLADQQRELCVGVQALMAQKNP